MKFSPSIKTILVLLLWLVCIYKTYVDFDREYLFDTLIHNALIIIASIVSAFAINSDYSHYRQHKKLISFFSSIITILCITGLLSISYYLKKQDQTPTIIYAARNNSGMGRITLDFRANNTYKLGRHRFFSVDYNRGKYIMTDSIIYLDNPHESELLLSDKLLITKNPNYDSTKKKNTLKAIFGTPEDDVTASTLLYQINNSGHKVESAISFKVIEKPFD